MASKAINIQDAEAVKEPPQQTTAPQADDIKANPNQISYDATHTTDHMLELLEVYFAMQVKKYKQEPGEELYVAKGGEKIKDLLKKREKKDRKNINASPSHTNALKAKEEIKITWEDKKEDGTELQKITGGRLKKKVFVVAKCAGESGKLSLEIHENIQKYKEPVYEGAVNFLVEKEQKNKIEFTIQKDKIEYSQEITLRPASDDDLKKLTDNFNKREEENAFLYFKAELTPSGKDEKKYPGDDPEVLNHDGDRFEIKYCNCCDNTVEKDGFIKWPQTGKKHANQIVAHEAFDKVIAIILHRTTGYSTEGAMAERIGTHFYVDGPRGVDGEIFQPVSLDYCTHHINDVDARTNNLNIQTENSIGIEVVGMAYYYKNDVLFTTNNNQVKNPEKIILSKGYEDGKKNTFYWDALTEKQIKSVSCLVNFLLTKYSLSINDIYCHEEIQSKTAGEGQVVKEAILPYIS